MSDEHKNEPGIPFQKSMSRADEQRSLTINNSRGENPNKHLSPFEKVKLQEATKKK